jgi:4-alpha-glucanotransferase
MKQAILHALGVAAGDLAGLQHSLAMLSRREWESLIPPAVVADESDEIEFPLNLPVDRVGEPTRISVVREDGQQQKFELRLGDLPQTGSVEMDGRTWVRIQVSLPVRLPLGYHAVSVELGALTASTRYIVTPKRVWMNARLGQGGRVAGVAVSLFGVRSKRNWGCGDFGDLNEVVEWVSQDLGASFVALNPLHAIHNRRPFNCSPYSPNSILYRNFLYLDIENMDDFSSCRRARELRSSPQVASEIDSLRGSQFVEYERVSALKLRFLKLLFVQFLREWRTQSRRAREFQLFLGREGDLLEKFATYCALDECLHRKHPEMWVWTDWPLPYRDPDSEETRIFRSKNWRRVLFYEYLQWQIDLQLGRAQRKARDRGLSIGLYHDLAMATDRFGTDLWAHGPFYIGGCRVGSPPDDFSPHGQDWRFPPPNSARHREDGYRLFAESIRKNCRHGGALRIDHVMRFFRLYWIPDGSDATQGTYVRERSDDLLRILALESVRNQVIIVGEDLGTVEAGVREELARFGIFSYRLFYFEKREDGAFRGYAEYPRQALVSSTTHDLPTLAGFWIGADIRARRAAGLLDPQDFDRQINGREAEKQRMLDVLSDSGLLPSGSPRTASAYPDLTDELHRAIVGFLSLASCQLLAINHEDLTKEINQQNLPGTVGEYPNWSRKMQYTLEELRSDPQACRYSAMLRKWIVDSGRRNFPE